MEYLKWNAWTEKDQFSLSFIDQMLDRLARKGWYCFLDGYSGYNQVSIAPKDQETQLSHAPMGPSPSNLCYLGCAMLQQLFKVV